jgi:uncharacterized protein with NRDE domain
MAKNKTRTEIHISGNSSIGAVAIGAGAIASSYTNARKMRRQPTTCIAINISSGSRSALAAYLELVSKSLRESDGQPPTMPNELNGSISITMVRS